MLLNDDMPSARHVTTDNDGHDPLWRVPIPPPSTVLRV